MLLLWLKENLATILVCLLLALIVFFIVRGMIRDRRAGKSSCGGNCAGCGICGKCGGTEAHRP